MGLLPLIRPHMHAQPTLESGVWFLQLRWIAVAGQLLTMAVVALAMHIALPTLPLLGLIGTTAASNTAYAFWLKHLENSGLARSDRLPTEQVVSSLILVDILVLTGMLYLSAGTANPFSLYYFVNIAVAGAILTPAWAWGVWAATVAGVTFLLVNNLPIPELTAASVLSDEAQNGGVWSIPRVGFLVAFATSSGVITYFITILTGELRQREMALQDAEDERIRNRQLEALATLAAGAGHELASPLSTIAVVAKELSLALQRQGASESVTRDVALIRSELDRCRHILDRMTSAAGEAAGERLQTVHVEEFLDEAVLGIREPQRVEIEVDDSALDKPALLPLQAAALALRNLIQNALDASQPGANVTLRASLSTGEWQIEVIDRGDGMLPEVLQRIGEPFFTTKEPGRGMGLGLHLTQNVIRRLNGDLAFESKPGHGTRATITLPLNRS